MDWLAGLGDWRAGVAGQAGLAGWLASWLGWLAGLLTPHTHSTPPLLTHTTTHTHHAPPTHTQLPTQSRPHLTHTHTKHSLWLNDVSCASMWQHSWLLSAFLALCLIVVSPFSNIACWYPSQMLTHPDASFPHACLSRSSLMFAFTSCSRSSARQPHSLLANGLLLMDWC